MSDETIDHAARADMATHNAVCTERYGNLWEAVKGLREDFQSARIQRASADAVIHERFNAISNRMWLALAGVCGAAVIGLAVVVFHLVTKVH